MHWGTKTKPTTYVVAIFALLLSFWYQTQNIWVIFVLCTYWVCTIYVVWGWLWTNTTCVCVSICVHYAYTNCILKCGCLLTVSIHGCACMLSHVWLFVTPWTAACQARNWEQRPKVHTMKPQQAVWKGRVWLGVAGHIRCRLEHREPVTRRQLKGHAGISKELQLLVKRSQKGLPWWSSG